MWKRLKEFLGFSTEENPEESPIFVEADDPFMAMIVAEVLKTGKPQIGRIDEKGYFTITEVKE